MQCFINFFCPGIFLWEIFSLGKTPYTGMEANLNLYHLLMNGYRMEKPPFATQKIYDVMLSCWFTNPESRPLFEKLATTIGDLMQHGVGDVSLT